MFALGPLVAIALACADATSADGSRSSRGQPIVIGGPGGATATRNPIVVGTWWNVLYVADDAGQLHAWETVWDLAASGSASRTVTTWNVTFGFTDTSHATGRWSTVADTLVLALDWPEAWNARLPYRIEEGIGVTWLHIGRTAFRRVR